MTAADRHQNEKEASGFRAVLLYGPLIALPFLFLFDGPKVYWNGPLREVPLVLSEKPRYYSSEGGDEYILREGAFTYSVRGDALRQLRQPPPGTPLVQDLRDDDTLLAEVAGAGRNGTPRIIGLRYRGVRVIDPARVHREERKKIFIQSGVLLALFALGLTWTLRLRRSKKQ
ncbi:hypothetical protein [Flaviaesturariibacter amylovorans]|uniref:DUF3592 domain-containing protein n=1 Tax=Flaviaesturariibacter amylovorans TaxID=1084520 RepID=A0ABP8GE73_9BACT